MTKTVSAPPAGEAVYLGGSGQPVLLLHGYIADRLTWLGTAPALFDHGRIQALEIPGHGDAWQIPPAATLTAMAEQLQPALSGADDAPVHLIGHSLGAALLLLCAAREPQRVASITLLAPLGLGGTVRLELLQQLHCTSEPEHALQLLQSMVCDPRLISRQLVPLLLAQLSRDGVRQACQRCVQAIAGGAEELQRAAASVVASDLPRQVIWGEQDPVSPAPQGDPQDFGGRWYRLQQCGHLPHIEQRSRVNALLQEFLQTSH